MPVWETLLLYRRSRYLLIGQRKKYLKRRKRVNNVQVEAIQGEILMSKALKNGFTQRHARERDEARKSECNSPLTGGLSRVTPTVSLGPSYNQCEI